MGIVNVRTFNVSLDGFSAGPDQDLDHPLGHGGQAIFDWFMATEKWNAMHGTSGGTTGMDNDMAVKAFENVGAWIMGRNMFGPVRGNWPDDAWTGWWGDDPPFHVPTFVLTHHARPPVTMQGGTVFHFVTDGIESALAKARAAAGAKDVRIGGGPATVRQFLRARLIDELHLAYAPALLGAGESLFSGIDLPALGYRVGSAVASPRVYHVTIVKA